MNEKLKKELDAASAAYNSWFSNWNTGGPRGGGVALMRMDEQGNGYIDTGMSLRGFTAGTRGDAMRGWQSDASYFNGMYNPSPTSQGIGRQLHKLMAKALAGDEEAARDYIDISRETISQPVGRSTSEASKWASKYGGGYNPPVAGINGKFAGGASNMVVGGSNRSQGTSSGRASVSSSSLPKTTLSSAGALVTTGGASQSTSRRGRKGKGSKGKGSKMKGGGAPITQSSKPVLKLDNNYNLSVGGDKEALERLSKAPISTPVAPAPDDAAKETQALMSQPVMLISEEEKAKKEKETQGANKKFITKDGKTFQVNVKSGDLAQGMITEAQAGPGGYAGGQTAPTMGEKVQGGVTKPFINAQLEDGVTMEDVDKSYATLWQFQSGQSGMR